jgi:hypothetical protein
MDKTLAPLKAKALADDEFEAWFEGKVPRRLLAIPFYGPIPHADGKGRDLDGEYFDDRTDIYGPYPGLRRSRERLVDFMHSYQPPSPAYGDDTGMMKGALLGKSILDPNPDEDGWWVDLWLDRGNARVAMVKRLAERGAQLYGSSQPVGHVAKGRDGHIEVWPFWLQTITTTPQNTLSVIRPKALLLGIERLLETDENRWSDIETALRSLAPSLRVPPSQAELEAKAGRVLSAANEGDLRDALDALRSGLDRLEAVVRRQPDYNFTKETMQ